MSRMQPRIEPGTGWGRELAGRLRFLVVLGCVAVVALIGWLDHATGTDLRVYPLYYAPIGLSAMLVSRRFGVLVALLSGGAWFVAMRHSDIGWGAAVFAANTVVQAVSFLVVALLVSSLRLRFELERELSHTDSLTGLPNRRALTKLATVLVEGARRSGRPLTVACLDLDRFKEVNDTAGHLAGDAVLRTTAEVLRGNTRAADVVLRLGGDEFTLLIPDADADAARVLLDRLVELLAARMAEGGWPVTASIGAVTFALVPTSIDDIIKWADGLMYRAKEAGRNRVVHEQVGG